MMQFYVPEVTEIEQVMEDAAGLDQPMGESETVVSPSGQTVEERLAAAGVPGATPP